MVAANLRGIPASYISSEISDDCPGDQRKQFILYLELGKRETASSSYSAIVLESGAAYDGLQLVDWTRSDICGFLNASVATS